MSWQDRKYGSGLNNDGETPFANPLLNILLGSLPLGTWFGIRVRIHATLLWFFVFQLLRAGAIGWVNVAISTILLFSIVLLHEFGHCFGARMVGGRPDHILLWPFGGLAYSGHDHNPWARFVTVVCGPLVNVILVGVLGAIFFAATHTLPPLNPLVPWIDSISENYFLSHPAAVHIYEIAGGRWLLWAFTTNWMLLTFNLLPIFPLDGGQLLQSILWKFIGYYRSMNISCIVGMVAAVPFGLWGLFQNTLFTVCLAIVGFMTCFRQRRELKMNHSADEEEYDLSAAWDEPGSVKVRQKKKQRWANAARKRAREEQAEQARIDAILDKVKEQGLHSLTWGEKRALRKATERQRERDLARRG
jgi:Zn-dependent protease